MFRKSVPITVGLPIRGTREKSRLTPECFAGCEDLVMCDATDSPGNTTQSEEIEGLEDSTVIQEETVITPAVETRITRTLLTREETSPAKRHAHSETRDTNDNTNSAESVAEAEHSNDCRAVTDPIELYGDVSDGYLGEESDVSMSGDG